MKGKLVKKNKPTVLIISASDFDNDSRLKRFHRHISMYDFQVLTVTYGTSMNNAEMHLSPIPKRSLPSRLIDVAKILSTRVLSDRQFLKILSTRLITQDLTKNSMKLVEKKSVDLVVVKHWTSLPTAVLLKGNPQIWLDINEVFEAEHDNSILWILIYKPAILRLLKIVENRIVLRSATSLDQIKDMGDESVLHLPNTKEPISKIKNNGSETQIIRLLYHGLITTNRSLETIIHALKQSSRADMHLTIRGHGKPEYINSLKSLVEAVDLSSQVTFEPSIPNSKLIKVTSEFDLGFCLFANKSKQLMLAEPNKIYEYMAAGLGIIASKTPAMERMVQDKKIGALSAIGEKQTQLVSEILSGLTIEQINQWKKAAHKEAVATWKSDYDWPKLDSFLQRVQSGRRNI